MCNESREQCSSARCVNCVVLTSYDSDSDWCPSDAFEGLAPPLELGGVTNKRARSRRRHKKAKRDAKASKECDDVIDLHAYLGPIEWVDVQYGKLQSILTQSAECEDLEEKISDFTQEEIVRAIASYEHFHR